MLLPEALELPVIKEMYDLAERITADERLPHWVEPEDDLSPEYRERIIFWIRRHGLTETGGGRTFFNMITYAPNGRAAEALCEVAQDEIRHGYQNLDLLAPFDIDPNETFRSRWVGDDTALRQKAGIPVPAPHKSWPGVVAWTMIADPGGIIVVGERVFSNYGSWARANAQILMDEKQHASFWDHFGKDVMQTAEGRSAVQAAADRMYAKCLGMVGRREDPEFERDKALGIRTHSGAEYQDALRRWYALIFDYAGLQDPNLPADESQPLL